MPRAPKACGHHGCTVRVQGRTYCTQHEAEAQRALAAKRGTTAQRGYGSQHQKLRKQWAPAVARGEVACWRCGKPIAAGQAWDIGHDDIDRSITRGPEHVRCNRATARRRGPTTPPNPPGA